MLSVSMDGEIQPLMSWVQICRLSLRNDWCCKLETLGRSHTILSRIHRIYLESTRTLTMSVRASPPLAPNGRGLRPSPPCRCQEKHRTPTPRSSPHPQPVLAAPLRLDLVRFLSSSSFLPPFPPQQAKVRNKIAHLQNSRRPVWKKLNSHGSLPRSEH